MSLKITAKKKKKTCEKKVARPINIHKYITIDLILLFSKFFGLSIMYIENKD